jgi:hypothetical protein
MTERIEIIVHPAEMPRMTREVIGALLMWDIIPALHPNKFLKRAWLLNEIETFVDFRKEVRGDSESHRSPVTRLYAIWDDAVKTVEPPRKDEWQ